MNDRISASDLNETLLRDIARARYEYTRRPADRPALSGRWVIAYPLSGSKVPSFPGVDVWREKGLIDDITVNGRCYYVLSEQAARIRAEITAEQSSAPASTPAPAAGRPPVGPKVEVRLTDEALAQLDRDARRQQISRAEWIRSAVQQALPAPGLTDLGRRALTDTLNELAANVGLREEALDPAVPQGERVIAAERYATTLHEMRTMLGSLRGSLPRQEAMTAYTEAIGSDPQMSQVETARAWGRAEAAGTLDRLLDAITLLLPVDGASILTRAEGPAADVD
ncbi:CopG family transcriptional regulator [Streptomyces sp. NPDC051597]|uniref:ribbon-helix-helix domain-containing protein n=1 Tax=Streptomyces sp. NPDC051597 TaxID=3155049 RepID=UPI003425FB5A